jgi:hypothetical protein
VKTSIHSVRVEVSINVHTKFSEIRSAGPKTERGGAQTAL